jgi:hypothetical protein
MNAWLIAAGAALALGICCYKLARHLQRRNSVRFVLVLLEPVLDICCVMCLVACVLCLLISVA